MRPHRHAIVSFAAALLLACAAAAPASAFQVYRHSNMTGEVLARQGVNGNALSFIQQGVRWPDITQCIPGCYCPAYLQVFCTPPDSNQVRTYSVSHFDNNMLVESRANVELLMSLARAGLTPPAGVPTDEDRRRVGVALMFFGEALHAIQDFYAHSTWVDVNRDLIRVGGHIESLPLWNGEDLGGPADLGGLTIYGTQTGFVELPTPAGSVSHDVLNKDAPGTSQGALVIRRIFPSTVIGTKYEIVSGQVGGTFAGYQDVGAAPRHSIKAWQCLQAGCAIYNLPEFAANGAARERVAQPLNAQDFASLIAWVNSDPGMTEAAHRIDSLWTASNPDTPSTYPLDQFDANGWPLPATASVGDDDSPRLRLLSDGMPNPFHGRTVLRFLAPRAGRAKLEVFDMSGRRRQQLLDESVAPGWKEVRWDGRDAAGRALESGTYVCRLTGFGRDESVRVTVLR